MRAPHPPVPQDQKKLGLKRVKDLCVHLLTSAVQIVERMQTVFRHLKQSFHLRTTNRITERGEGLLNKKIIDKHCWSQHTAVDRQGGRINVVAVRWDSTVLINKYKH